MGVATRSVGVLQAGFQRGHQFQARLAIVAGISQFGLDLRQVPPQVAVAVAGLVQHPQIGQVASADLLLQGFQLDRERLQFGLGELHILGQLIDQALGLEAADDAQLGFKLLANRVRQRDGAGPVAVFDFEVKNLALAELRPLGRRNSYRVLQVGDVVLVGPGLPRAALHRRQMPKGLGRHAAAAGDLHNGLLRRLHLILLPKAARPLLRVVHRFIPQNQCLRRHPGVRLEPQVGPGQQ